MKAANKGFTLIEMMIVVAVIAILAAIAVPSYVDYLRRGAIPEGLAGLSDGKVKMEQFFMDFRTYNNGTDDGCTRVSAAAGRFTITCASTATTYTLTATGGGNVAGLVYTIDQTNTRQTTGSHASWPTTKWDDFPRTCWVLKKDGSC